MSNVPESIRATATEAAWEATTAWAVDFGDDRPLTEAIVDAVLPAVVAQVQADTLEEVVNDAQIWDVEYCDCGNINGGQVAEGIEKRAAEYREKGENDVTRRYEQSNAKRTRKLWSRSLCVGRIP